LREKLKIITWTHHENRTRVPTPNSDNYATMFCFNCWFVLICDLDIFCCIISRNYPVISIRLMFISMICISLFSVQLPCSLRSFQAKVEKQLSFPVLLAIVKTRAQEVTHSCPHTSPLCSSTVYLRL